VPLERLEARICELAGHLTAAACQFLLLVADFDARQGWAAWEMPSCAAWLSWKCQIAPGTAREQVRVARALGGFPLITAGFAAGRLSYAKVRALTRIAAPDTEAGLAEMATPMTAAQLERFARAHRRVTRDQDQQARARRKLSWCWVDDFEFAFRGLLPPQEAAVVLQALRAAMNDLDHPHDHDQDHENEDVSAETPPATTPSSPRPPSSPRTPANGSTCTSPCGSPSPTPAPKPNAANANNKTKRQLRCCAGVRAEISRVVQAPVDGELVVQSGNLPI
jgi:hypothetical protein